MPIPVPLNVLASATWPSPTCALGQAVDGLRLPQAPVLTPMLAVRNVLVVIEALQATAFVGEEPIEMPTSKFGPTVRPFTTRLAAGSGGVVPALGPLPAMQAMP